ncbi:choline transporter-like protein 1 [Crassostrea angulata]|uniref:choline transporter-like protein 1 n=1 Tax=Magallana angulata TaxID=2784310 RepID=UPI0022B1B081|nr:choline transporter-like protein 1 [Crassostrea angulata]
MGCSSCCGKTKTTKVKPLKTEEDEDWPELEDGPIADRQCRDVVFLIIFILYLGGMVYVAYRGVSQGDPYRLVYGVDSWGNVCDRKNTPIPGVPLSGRDMSGKKRTLHLDPGYYTELLKTHIIPSFSSNPDIVVCLSHCPNETLSSSAEVDAYMARTNTSLCRYDTSAYVSDDDICLTPVKPHTSVFWRCIPDSVVMMVKGMSGSFTSLLSGISGGSFTQKVISDLKNTWVEILYLAAIAFGTSVVVVVLMWLLAAVIIWMLIFAVIAFSIGASGYSWYCWYRFDTRYKGLPANEQTEAERERTQTWLIYAAVTSAITLVLLLVLLIMRKRIQLVVQLFKEAGKALKCVPCLLLQPVWTLLILVGTVGGLVLIAVYIETSGQPNVNNQTQTVSYEMEKSWEYVRWYHIFGFLWISAFIVACQDFVIASAIATWYFKRDKSSMGCPIATAVWRIIRYHMGSIAFGSFIIAVVRLARLILAYIQSRLRGKSGPVVDFVLKVLQCCLWCFEKFLAYLNRNAYIEIAIFGHSFCTGAKKAFLLILENALRVAAINSIGDFVLFLGKLSTMAVVLVVGNEFFQGHEDVNYVFVPLTVSCAFAYAISHCFLLVYEITIDTIFLCFCEDCKENDGINKPYYMSTDLLNYMQKTSKIMNMDKQKKKKKEETDLATV